MSINVKEILDGKFWIVESEGEKVGTLSWNDDRYLLNSPGGSKFFDKKRDITAELGNDVRWTSLAIKEVLPAEKVSHGYPTSSIPFNSMYDVKKKLPLFTKSTKSKSLYCAGYYIIHFDKGWVKSFCPKLITVERYETKGPFTTELEMRQELSRVNASS